MLPPADSLGARPLRAVEPIAPPSPVGDPRREVFDRLTQIALGRTFQAQVLSRLNDGSYLIKLDNAALRASLPGDPAVGTALSLKFVATQPRPTFLLLQAPDADTASLSPAARLIDSILHASQGQRMAEAVTGKTAILPDASFETAKIAAALKQTLSASGVFYESHLSQWVEGSLPLDALKQEPQAKLGADAMRFAMPLQTGNGAPALPSQLVDIVADWDGGAPQSPSVTGTSTSASAAPIADAGGKELTQLLNLQLQALEQHKVVWQGELWPGRPLEWEVSEDLPQERQGDDAAPSWTSTVRFSLPSLGTVSATIRLSGQHMQMQLRAANEQTAALLRERSAELAGALDAAGSPLEAITVKQDEQA